ncbi:MAG: lysophospholipid acyltransferase family protein [Acidimicrobiia bacterium]|nr:lysophospholipid acyltransferase family protein [Acidimicrobiia bacterium]
MSSGPVRTILSIWSWAVLGVFVAVWTPMVAVVRLVTMPFDRGAYTAGYLFRRIAVAHEKLTPQWRFHTSGDLPDDIHHRPRQPYVVVANHESFVDILLISHLQTEMKWMSKIEIMKIPGLGWMMRLARDIPLTRGDSTSGAAALAASTERLESGVSVMIFPEGTRSKTGEMRKFRAGAFKIAIDGQYPILPLAVHGTRDALRKNDWRLGDADAEVRVLDPISTAGMTMDDLPALRDQVRKAIASARADLRTEFGVTSEPPGGD